MNEQDKERYRQEKEAYDRAVSGGAAVKVSAPAVASAAGQEAGTLQCIRAGCSNASVRNVEWEDEYCSNQCVVMHCDQVKAVPQGVSGFN